MSNMSMKLYAFVGMGGMIGAMARYSMTILFINSNGFPYATLVTNLIGCFLLSFLMNHQLVRQKLSKEAFTAMNVGVIGSFTTFSTFAVETITLYNTQPLMAMIYIMTSICAGLLFCYGGYRLARRRQVQ